MKTQHTPGPWHCKTMEPKYGGWSVGKTRHIEAGKSCDALTGRDMPAHDSDSRIARVLDGCAGANSHAEAEANARLIAAAPDLLAALKDQVTWTMRDGTPCACPAGRHEDEPTGKMPTIHSTSCETLRAAIAKAEGR